MAFDKGCAVSYQARSYQGLSQSVTTKNYQYANRQLEKSTGIKPGRCIDDRLAIHSRPIQ